jgi:RNAse (barnase) inhibitor barstar
LDDPANSGAYLAQGVVALKEIQRLALARDYAWFHIEGQKIEKKDQFLNHAAVAMGFPADFGNNWDAFEDCLTDLSWVDTKGFVILFDHFDTFLQHSGGQFETAMEVFKSAATYWRGQTCPLFVLLHGKGGTELGLKRVKLP